MGKTARSRVLWAVRWSLLALAGVTCGVAAGFVLALIRPRVPAPQPRTPSGTGSRQQ